jgi:hypothetical protein
VVVRIAFFSLFEIYKSLFFDFYRRLYRFVFFRFSEFRFAFFFALAKIASLFFRFSENRFASLFSKKIRCLSLFFAFFSLSLRFAIFSKIFVRFASLSLLAFVQNLHA